MTAVPATKYEGAEPGKVRVTDAEAERLRATVPDDPIPLPEGSLACEACGIAVPAVRATSSVTPPAPTDRSISRPVQFARCLECEAVRATAVEYVEAHPAFASRVGLDIATERVESVLFGLAILGQSSSGTDLQLLLRRMHPAAHGVWFSNPMTLTSGMCSPYPWAHVTLSQRAELRKAYAATMRDRLALGQPPVAVKCPTGGCVFCGVSSVQRAAIEVAQRGTHGVWREVDTNPKALGSKGPERIWGHACPACAAAIEEAGAIGWPARAVAVVAYLGHVDPKKARRLRALVEGDFPPVLPAWRVIPKARPAVEPWSHLRRAVFARL